MNFKTQNSLFNSNETQKNNFDFIEYDEKNIDISNSNIIGVDETGVGDYFGPLVVAAVFVPKEKVQLLKDFNIRDSKNIKSEKQLFFLYNKIKEHCAIKTYVLSNKGYNTLYKSMNNSNKLKFFAHTNAVNKLEEFLRIKKISYDFVFIDQYSTSNSFQKYGEELLKADNWAKITKFEKPLLSAHKAESLHVSVACASIVARATLLQKMKELNAKYNFEFSLGAGSKVKKLVEEFAKIHGDDMLNEVCKTHFKLKN